MLSLTLFYRKGLPFLNEHGLFVISIYTNYFTLFVLLANMGVPSKLVILSFSLRIINRLLFSRKLSLAEIEEKISSSKSFIRCRKFSISPLCGVAVSSTECSVFCRNDSPNLYKRVLHVFFF